MSRIIFGGFAIALFVLAGCMSSGTKMDAQQVDSQIKRGVTTRAEVEQKFGTPDHVAMMPDGRRSLYYTYYAAQVKGTSFIPYAGAFMGGSNQQRQSLQVMLNKDNIVEDYEFSEKATETSHTPFNTHTTEVPTSQPSK